MADEQKNTDQSTTVLSDIIKKTTDDVLKPKALDVANSAMSDIIYAIGDWLVGIIGRKLFGMDAPVATRSRSGRTPYEKMSQSQKPQVNTALRNSDELVEIRFENEKRAIEVIDDMRDRLSRFGKVSVGFLYDKTGKPQIQSDFRYGWTSIDDFGYIKNSRGIFFDASKPKPLS